MNYLLDTHILLWLMFEPEKLSFPAKNIIIEKPKSCYISGITFFEISLKYGLSKLSFGIFKPNDIYDEAIKLGFNILDFKTSDVIDFHNLPQHIHKDPFDKMLVWQAIKSNLTLISQDKKLEVYQENGLKIMF